MAIVLPLLLLVIAGIIDLGRLLFTQAIVTNSAREGVRMVALGYTPADAQTRVAVSSPGVQGGPLVSSVVQACPANPGPTSDARVTVTTTDFEWVILGNVAAFFGAAPDSSAAHVDSKHEVPGMIRKERGAVGTIVAILFAVE